MSEAIPETGKNWSSATFLIIGGQLKPGEIDSMLGLKGEIWKSKLPSPRSRHSVWQLKCPLGDQLSMEEHLKWLLDQLEPKTGAIRLLAKIYKLEFFCGFSSASGQGGFTLDNSTLSRIANLGIALGLDLYPPKPAE